MSEVFDVTIPQEVFLRCIETKQDQVWADDRGFVYRVEWDYQDNCAKAGCVARPTGSAESDIWYRRTPQPAHLRR